MQNYLKVEYKSVFRWVCETLLVATILGGCRVCVRGLIVEERGGVNRMLVYAAREVDGIVRVQNKDRLMGSFKLMLSLMLAACWLPEWHRGDPLPGSLLS